MATQQLVDGPRGRERGALGEASAQAYLEKRGYEILARNWRCFAGEADIVARQDGVVVLVEVKTRRCSPDHGAVFPEEAMNAAKRERYRRIAGCYLADHPEVERIRVDAVAVRWLDGAGARVRHVVDACVRDEAR